MRTRHITPKTLRKAASMSFHNGTSGLRSAASSFREVPSHLQA
jgi:hypothetical protein